MRKFLYLTSCFLLFINYAAAQNSVVATHLQTIAQENELSNQDIQDYAITSTHTSKLSNVTHYYLRQSIKGIEIFETQSSIHILEDESLFRYNNAFIKNVNPRIVNSTTNLSHADAILKAIDNFGYDDSSFPQEIESENNAQRQKLFSAGSVSQLAIPVKLMYYQKDDGTLHLCYDLSIYETDQTDWWSLKVDANTGEIVSQINWVVECNFEHNTSGHHECAEDQKCSKTSSRSNTLNPDSYNVYASPVESPNHGSRTLEADPANLIASPFGWHDTNGIPGAESTETRGNNVNAQEDENGNNGTGYAPDGGTSLDFDHPIDFNLAPNSTDNRDASLTNLFYWNNLIHDVLYQYGFDEAAGNFQENNYGNGGSSSDRVNADGLDGSGTNNANFATPPDGGNPRMQMFLWSAGVNSSTTINSPVDIAGPITGITGNFGPTSFNLTNDIVLADDGTANPTEACSALVNATDINGKIALIDRANCEFSAKALNAQNAGAVAVIICQHLPNPPFAMGPGAAGSSITIPSVMISRQECDSIKAYLPNVNITMSSTSTGQEIDGSFDNGIIVHEYGHGISNRLTGGGNNTGCLSNTEQMGEGWSDWYGMVMTIKPSDVATMGRGVGTYAISQPVTGGGIRDFPYSTDLAVDPRTYNNIQTASIPHGVGSVWCAMLWEMTWALIDTYGFDPDLHSGTGGNNIALALVTEGMKLQACSPGFVDGRDGILAADAALYGGQNECLIWAAFAKRGLGEGASQGSSASRSDGIESFVTPMTCEEIIIDKTVNSNSVIAGDTLTYTLTFDNQTSTTYNNLVISDTLLECLTYVSGSATSGATFTNGTVELSVPSVSPFTKVEVEFQAVVDSDVTTPTQDFFDDAENGQEFWFTSNQVAGAGTWKIDNTNSFNGASNWFAENKMMNSIQELVLKSPKKLTSTSELKFWHTYNSLSKSDGGKVEISIDNQNTWTDLDALFTQNGYNDYVLGTPTNPAFGGTNNTSYIETIADLSSFAGEYIHIKFTFYIRFNAPGIGWRVDDIFLSDTEKSVSNIGYFTAVPGLDDQASIFPPSDVIPATCNDGIQNGMETGVDVGGNCIPNGPCDFDLVLSGNPAPSDTYQAENQITSTANVGPNTNYFASTILLESDFEVELGNEFLAEINPCTAFNDDNEIALKVVSNDNINGAFDLVLDVNIPESGKYILQVIGEDGKISTLAEREFQTGVHRISLQSEVKFTNSEIIISKR